MLKHQTDVLVHYKEHGPITNPGEFKGLYKELPSDLTALCKVVQGLVLHVFWAERLGEKLSEERKKQVGIRHVKHILTQIQQTQGAPLDQSRSLEKRFIGNCRTFSVLLVSFLRHQGIPARARCGFGRYFKPGWFEDHWVCEYWNQKQVRWILVDAQLDEFQSKELKINFDPLDVLRDQFIVAGKAWDWCQNGVGDPDKFGIFDMHGLWFIRGNLIRDIAALNKVPLLPWDGWGLIDREQENLTKEELGLLDQLATLTFDEVDFPALREAYETRGGLAVPPIIKSYTPSGTQDIELETERILK